MNNRELAIRLVEALRWPVALTVIVLLLREPIAEFIRALTAAVAH